MKDLKDLKVSLDFPFFQDEKLNKERINHSRLKGNKNHCGWELLTIIHNLKKIRNTDWTDEEKRKKKNCQNGQWNFLTRSRIKKAMHAYSTRIDDSIPIQGTRGGGGKKKKKFLRNEREKESFGRVSVR